MRGSMIENGRDFLFIRHGQTPWGQDDILNGPQDLRLNETGRHQAETAYKTVQEHQTIKRPVIYSSHLQRAQETATIFANKFLLEIPIILKEGLQERYYGDYSKATTKNYRDYQPLDAESVETFQQRVRNALIEIFNQIPDSAGDLIVVSHQKVFEFLAQWLSNQQLRLEQGGVCYFKFKDGGFYPEIL